MSAQHTAEDAAILRRTDPRFMTWVADCQDYYHTRFYAGSVGQHDATARHHCLAAQGHHGREWLDLMDELAGRVAA